MKFIRQTHAAIQNPVINRATGPGQAGSGLAFYIAQTWKALITVGGLAFLIYFLIGGFQSITSAGDKNKLEQAQKHITNGLTGLIILVASFAIVSFISKVLDFDLLNINWNF